MLAASRYLIKDSLVNQKYREIKVYIWGKAMGSSEPDTINYAHFDILDENASINFNGSRTSQKIMWCLTGVVEIIWFLIIRGLTHILHDSFDVLRIKHGKELSIQDSIELVINQELQVYDKPTGDTTKIRNRRLLRPYKDDLHIQPMQGPKIKYNGAQHLV